MERRERYARIEEQNGSLTSRLEGLKVVKAEVQEDLRKHEAQLEKCLQNKEELRGMIEEGEAEA